jgi:hypothetical protein
MRRVVGAGIGMALVVVAASGQPAGVSAAAENTRAKLLKTRITVAFNKMPLREAMKEIAHLVEQATDRPIFWTYGGDGKAAPATPVTYSCKDKSVEQVLDELFRPLGLGYTVISADDQPRDGWIRIAPGTDRGVIASATPLEPLDPEEAMALARLAAAKVLIDQGKTTDAKLILGLVTSKFGKTKAAAEAKDLLEKLNK